MHCELFIREVLPCSVMSQEKETLYIAVYLHKLKIYSKTQTILDIVVPSLIATVSRSAPVPRHSQIELQNRSDALEKMKKRVATRSWVACDLGFEV